MQAASGLSASALPRLPAARLFLRASGGRRSARRRGAAACSGMEVEIKLRLKDAAAHARVAEALQGARLATHRQENFFFDGPNGELGARRNVLRCRFYNRDEKCLVTLKGQQVLKDGVGRGSEEEAPIEPALGRECVERDPSKLLTVPLPFVQRIKEEAGLTSLKCLGGFRNVRQDFKGPWQRDEQRRRWPRAAKLELDETLYDWGTVYEVEVETEEPEALKGDLEAFLQKHGVDYKYNTTTKFHNFITRALD